ncbi:ATP-grasp domain-containing protein [Aquabacterium sp. A7-Y]|uniref:ATP-grasp domain-containing protein n=1 Tax=Aquabacterium sp. A7-Y TaxID=1349605 RepID=UPI00223D27E5|nr:ATP-grasp domain-containing protein [Aquabacterium sp. A7-Y]MCW7539595.1 ATP-grasp domain-containing protein [Aquabacterium sp. A7-Y]
MNIVIVSNFARFPGTPRWDFELVRYEDFIDHEAHQVSYIANRKGRTAITAPPGRWRLHELEALHDIAAWRGLLRDIAAEHGPIDRLIVFSEFLLDIAAELREEFDIPGNRPADNRLGRDKLLMKHKVGSAGLRVPHYKAVSSSQAAEAVAFAREVGYPLILKPVDGASSAGVQVIADEAALRVALAALPPGEADLEEFIDGELYHVDGLVDVEGRVALLLPSRYVNNCFDFTRGAPLGSVMLEPGSALHQRVTGFSRACIEAIGLKACPFHLELFHSRRDELVFLEVGARVAGADVPYMIHRSTGVNLFAEWVAMAMGGTGRVSAEPRELGGWLMFPRPPGLPLRVEAVTRFLGRLPTVYRELVPQEGQLLEPDTGYASMQSGRFLFAAQRAHAIERDIATVLREFSLTTRQA